MTGRKFTGKLAERFKDSYTLNDMPYPAAKAGREAFETMKIGMEETMMLDGPGQISRGAGLGRMAGVDVAT